MILYSSCEGGRPVGSVYSSSELEHNTNYFFIVDVAHFQLPHP